MISLLLTCIGQRVCFVKNIKKIFGSNSKIIGLDLDKFAPSLFFTDYSDTVLPVNRNNYKKYLISIMDICLKYKVNYILPLSDADLYILSKSKKLFTKNQIKILSDDSDIISLCNNKIATNNFFKKKLNDLKNIEIIIPEYNRLDEKTIIKWELFPSVIKEIGDNYTITNKHYIIKNKKECYKYLIDNKKYMIQRYIDGEEYTVDCFYDTNVNKMVICVPRIRLRIYNGVSVCGKIMNDGTIINNCVLIQKIFNLTGFFNIQFIKNNNKLYFLEINPRVSGGIMISVKAGNPILSKFHNYLMGRKNTPYLNNTKEDKKEIISYFDYEVIKP